MVKISANHTNTGLKTYRLFCVSPGEDKKTSAEIRKAIVPAARGTAKIGPDYNGKLSGFVQELWDVNEALKHSPSLKRKFKAIKAFRPIYSSGTHTSSSSKTK